MKNLILLIIFLVQSFVFGQYIISCGSGVAGNSEWCSGDGYGCAINDYCSPENYDDYYGNIYNESYYDAFGNLYNWYAVDDSRGICSEGWHVPSEIEWQELELYLGISEEEIVTRLLILTIPTLRIVRPTP